MARKDALQLEFLVALERLAIQNGVRSVLAQALLNGHTLMARWLADRLPKRRVNDRWGEQGDTLLMCAANMDNLYVAKALLKKGAQATAVNDNKWTALHYAQSREMIDLLMEHGADIDAVNNDGNVPADLMMRRMKEGVERTCRKYRRPPK